VQVTAATLTARIAGVTTKELMARIGHSSSRPALIQHHAAANVTAASPTPWTPKLPLHRLARPLS
jgi:hypothetical protein